MDDGDDFQNGMKAFRDGRYEDAIAHFENAIEKDENNEKAWNAYGVTCSKLGRNDDAIICFENALSLNPENTTYEKNLLKIKNKIVIPNKFTNRKQNSTKFQSTNKKQKKNTPISLGNIIGGLIAQYLVYFIITSGISAHNYRTELSNWTLETTPIQTIIPESSSNFLIIAPTQPKTNTYDNYYDDNASQKQVKKAQIGDTVTVDYIGTYDNGTVFDSSKIQNESFTFKLGSDAAIPGFASPIVDMKIGETQKFRLTPEQAYGEYNPSKIVEMPRNFIPKYEKVKVGDKVTLFDGEKNFTAKIFALSDKTVIFDLNHDLAGKNLNFEITLKNIS
jgi:FKBP-type peptidyl-prolyl cis-trans isomerase 2